MTDVIELLGRRATCRKHRKTGTIERVTFTLYGEVRVTLADESREFPVIETDLKHIDLLAGRVVRVPIFQRELFTNNP